MPFIVMPSIHLRGGRCVRLVHGDPKNEVVYSTDPAAVARKFAEQGATWIHVVDLDGAFTGKPMQQPQLVAIQKTAPGVKLQVGGGIRTPQAVSDLLNLGADRLIVGTAAVDQPDFVMQLARQHGDKVTVSMDVRDDVVVTRGGKEGSGWNPESFAEKLADWGVRWLLVTDIERFGARTGPNVPLARIVAAASRLPVFVNGGIATREHVQSLRAFEQSRIAGAIVGGSAVFEGTLKLSDLGMDLPAKRQPVAA